MKKLFFILLFFSLGQSYAQSKKEQIAVLQFQVDSLRGKLITERNLNSQNVELLNAKISNLQVEASQLKTQKKELDNNLKKKEKALDEVNIQLNYSEKKLSSLQNEFDSLSSSFKRFSSKNRLAQLIFDDKYYGLLNYNNPKDLSGYWDVGFWWSQERDAPESWSSLYFIYFPNSNLSCKDPVFYELTLKKNNGDKITWEIKEPYSGGPNKDISIEVDIELVETGFGEQIVEVRIKNFKNNLCVGPATN